MTTAQQAAMDAALNQHYAAEAARDLDGLLANLSDDVVHDVVGDPSGALRSREAIRQRYQTLFQDLHEESITPIRRLYGDGFVVDEAVWRGKAVGQPFGIEGRGRPLEFRVLHVCEVADGKLTSEQVWLDMGSVMQQLMG